MNILKISGGVPLKGDVCVGGAKNASMPIIIASILSQTKCILHNVPHVSDITNLLKILSELGSKIIVNGTHTQNPSKTITIHSSNISSEVDNYNLTSQIRTSILLLGPILARNGYVKISRPGGCNIGDRKIDLHIMAMEKLGANIIENDDHIIASTNGKKLKGTLIEFPSISVGATENTLMASVLAEGQTILRNIAIEPEIEDLVSFLNTMGAKITKTGEREFTINGVEKLHSTEYYIVADRIEAATYAIMAAITDGEINIHHCDINTFDCVHDVFTKAGIELVEKIGDNNSKIVTAKRSSEGLRPVDIETNPYPLFPTDVQPQLMVLLCLANGKSKIVENIFENRLQHVSELQKLGANLSVQGREVIVNGIECFKSGEVKSTDLRAGAALVIAALSSKGPVIVDEVKYIKRGYQSFVKNLQRIGANITIL